ncbi:unnamed protein product [Peronospora destructor]|uniref:Helicase-associated domain-containing protein n=1 Tax=Peronospora destructor TaxID=86335 RepID=A0AAV0UKT5_9STRA|nr:unnamed protein product [Peronospora destructor]
MLYDIYVAIDAYLQGKKRLSTRPIRIQLLKTFVAVEESVVATSSTTEGQKDDNLKSWKKKKGRGGNHSKNLNDYQPKRVDVEAVRRISENLLKARKAKDGQHDFRQMLAARAKLPAGKEEAQVIKCVQNNQVVLICGATGCQLLDCWAARAACDQRKGRAGRVQAGTCYRLFSRKRFAAMDAQLSAEIHRVSLEQLCLQIKKLEFGSIKVFLSKAIEPPAEDAIDAAIQELVDIAAFRIVSPKKNLHVDIKRVDDEEVVLTPLGNHLAMLPLDARIGKFLVYGSILRCIQPVAIIAACISNRNPFLMSMSDPEMRAKQDALKKELGGSWKSDHLLLWKLVERYVPLRGQKMKREFCRDIGLSYDTMESILDLKQQYLQQLDNIGFYESCNADNLNENSNAPRIIKAALCAGLYANVAQVVYPEQKYFQSAHGAVEEDHNAKQIRYFVRSTTEADQRERVFLHPSSCNFTQTNYDSPWLLYTELVQTSKIFVRESTMVNPYALLLFGGQLVVIHEKNLLTLDGFIRFNAVARIGVLIKSIRQHLDRLLMEKIADPSVDIAQSQLVTAISHLLKSEGMYAGA